VRLATLAGLAALCAAAPAQAQWQLSGHVKYQFSLQRFEPGDLGAILVAPTPADHTLDLRLNTTYRRRRIDVTAAGELLVLAGDTIAARQRTPGGGVGDYLVSLPDLADTHQWLDLGHEQTMGDRAELAGRLDRLSIGYTGEHVVARLGRQAITWGNGLVFQTLDLFNPFPPNVLDVDYKPGRDMLTTQWLIATGDDVQAIVVPGREDRGQPLTLAQSSVAAKWHHSSGDAEWDVLLARHDGDAVVGGGVSHSLAGGIWRVDVSHARLATRHVTSMLGNFDRAWTPRGHTLYGFGEYFYNGFGVSDTGPGAIEIDSALLGRLERGEVFNLGRHELAGGVRYDWTPLVTLSPTAIINLRDGSTFALVQVKYDWRQNLVLFAGLQAGLGSRGTEYGGATVEGLPGYLAPGARVWMRLARYF